MRLTKNIYEASPVAVQNMLCGMKGRKILHERFGAEFDQRLEWLKQTQWWSRRELENYQDQQLAGLIQHCYQSVPYYRRIMDERGLKPHNIRTRDDLPKLPVLTKDQVRASADEMVSRAIPKQKLLHSHTSGTTGTSLSLYTTREAVQFQWAVWWRHRNWLGLSFGDRHATFSGKRVVPIRQSAPPYHRHIRPMNRIYLSVYHLGPEAIEQYARAVEDFKPRFVNGYASALYLFSVLLEEKNIRLRHRPQWVISGSETMLEWQRRRIEQNIAPVSEHYGQAEQCGNMSRCECGLFHEDMEYGIIERVPLDGAGPSGPCRMLMTGLTNWAMPFIRYDIGDIATFSDLDCKCGRHSPTADFVDGRIDSFIVTPEGRMVGRLDQIFYRTYKIVKAQVLQERVEKITVKIVRDKSYGLDDEKAVLKEFRGRVGDSIDINIKYVDSIPCTANGKFRGVISTVGPKYLHHK